LLKGRKILKDCMFTLFHHPFCPHSRFIRLILGEYGFDLRLVEERAWERREAFLVLNPAGTTPVLFAEGMPAIPGAGVIAEYIDEAYGGEAAAAGNDGRARRGSPAVGLVQRQVF
jgi:glutathione S-transferase